MLRPALLAATVSSIALLSAGSALAQVQTQAQTEAQMMATKDRELPDPR